MIEKMITSKIRLKLLKLYLTNIDDRYYLRELERKLEESLSPLRRQLLKLEKMGILKSEYEANIKYYRLNKEFAGIEELQRLVLEERPIEIQPVDQTFPQPTQKVIISEIKPQPKPAPVARRIKYDVAVLTFVAMFVLATSVFVVYTNSRNVRQLAGMVSEKSEAPAQLAKPTRPDELVSRRWKVIPGNYPALSSGESGGKKSEEL